MCCSVGFARSLGFALLPLALCSMLANLLLLFPMGNISYLQEDRLDRYVWFWGGLGGGGLLNKQNQENQEVEEVQENSEEIV
ncbi:unnamed protein product [Merluccius merluccius]